MELGKIGTIAFVNKKKTLGISKNITIVFVVSGDGEVRINKEVSHLSKNDIYVVNPGKKADISGRGDFALITIKQKFIFFFQSIDTIINCTPDERENLAYPNLSRLLLNIVDETISENYEVVLPMVLRVIELLTQNFSVNISEQQKGIVDTIKSFIESNYFSTLTLVQIAEEIGKSPQYISSIFKEKTDQNVIAYLNDTRLRASANDLINTKNSVIDIAFDNGFTSVITYNRQFKKKYGITPTSYRAKNERSNVNDMSEEKRVITNVIKTRKQEKDTDSYINIKLNKTTPLNMFWKDILRYEKPKFDDNIQEKLRKLNGKYISFEIKQIKAILNDSDMIDIEKKLDKFLRLSIKPIFKFDLTKQVIDEKLINNISMDVYVLLKYFANIVSFRNVAEWRFEIQVASGKGLVDLQKRIHSSCIHFENYQRLIVGGSYKCICKLVQEKEYEFDYSLMLKESIGDLNIRLDDELAYSAIEIIKLLHEKLNGNMLLIEDLNLISSDNRLLNDTEYFGSLYLFFVLQTWGCIDGMEIPLIQDYAENDKHGFLNGQPGLFSADGPEKPIYQILSFLNRIGRYYVCHNENSLVSFDGFNDISIVSGNYNPIFHTNYSLTYDNYEGVFQNKESETIHYHFKSVKNGKYRIKIRRVNKKYGNLVHYWAHLQYLENLSTSELNYLKNSSQPDLVMFDVLIENGEYDLSIKLESNEVAYIHMIYRY